MENNVSMEINNYYFYFCFWMIYINVWVRYMIKVNIEY